MTGSTCIKNIYLRDDRQNAAQTMKTVCYSAKPQYERRSSHKLYMDYRHNHKGMQGSQDIKTEIG
jgi:hypothetical protein